MAERRAAPARYARMQGCAGLRAGTNLAPRPRPPGTGAAFVPGGDAAPHARGRCRAHTGDMGRMIWAILGAALAAWVAVMAVGGIVAMVKAFVIIGLIAVVVVIVVWLLARRSRRD